MVVHCFCPRPMRVLRYEHVYILLFAGGLASCNCAPGTASGRLVGSHICTLKNTISSYHCLFKTLKVYMMMHTILSVLDDDCVLVLWISDPGWWSQNHIIDNDIQLGTDRRVCSAPVLTILHANGTPGMFPPSTRRNVIAIYCTFVLFYVTRQANPSGCFLKVRHLEN